MSSGQILAAIDVGSNTILLLIAKYDSDSGLTVIEEAEDQPRLGAGLGATGRLSDESMKLALQSLARMLERCREHGVARVAGVATAAMREAKNGNDFVTQVRELGIPLRIISPEEEAALAYRSAAYHFPGSGRMLIGDIGGGSLELVGAVEGRIELTDSLPLGAVRLTELCLPQVKLREHIARILGPALYRERWRGSKVIGSGGTFASLAAMSLARKGRPRQPIHGVQITTPAVEQLLTELAVMSEEQRKGVAGLPPKRADIIVAGLAVAAEVLRRVEAPEVTVSGYGVREGLLLEMAEAD